MCFFWIVCKYKLNICCSFHCIGFFPMRLCKEKESFTQKESFRRLSILFLYPNYPCSSSSLCFQHHSLAATPFSLCVFWGIFHPLQGAVKSQLWGFFITWAVKISEAGGISSPAALVPWQEGRGHTQDSLIPSHSVKSPTIPQGYSDISVTFICSESRANPKIRSSGAFSTVGNSPRGQRIAEAQICWAAAD